MLLGFGLFSRILVRIGLEGDNEDRGGCMDVRTYVRTDRLPVFFRTLSPSGPLPKNKQKDVSFSIMGGCHGNTSLFLLKCEYFKQRIFRNIAQSNLLQFFHSMFQRCHELIDWSIDRVDFQCL